MHPLQYVRAMEMWNDGVPVKEIAAVLGVSKENVYMIAHNHRGDFPRRHKWKEPEWLEKAIGLRERGMTYAEIGRVVGVSQQAVGAWLNEAGMA